VGGRDNRFSKHTRGGGGGQITTHWQHDRMEEKKAEQASGNRKNVEERGGEMQKEKKKGDSLQTEEVLTLL